MTRKSINRRSMRRKLRDISHDPLSLFLRTCLLLAMITTTGVILHLVGYILFMGLPYLTPSLFEWIYTSENVSLLPALINTLIMTLLSLLLAVPIGVFAAVYLTEYAQRGNILVTLIRLTSETLAGIPSIIYGLFGMLFFLVTLHWGYSLLAGACTLAIMILPLIMRTTEEALLSVSDTYREGSFALGAGRLRTVFIIVLPSAIPGILGGVILATGRIVGETAALIFTAGTVAKIPGNFFSLTKASNGFFSSTRTLAVHMYTLASEGLHIEQTYATAVVLLFLVVMINALSAYVAKRISGGQEQ